ncbi:MAG TPA: MucB/RseB C-terminal domain-containing protein [Burkholderiaceae bacterium]|nr:MucB/RseB C-terminal domain-containing protein [Burkholderiaceae bacterium]
MQLGKRYPWFFWGLLLLAGEGAWAQSGSTVGPIQGDHTAEAVRWLERIGLAGERSHYVGTVVMQQGDEVRVSRIAHAFDQGVLKERVQTLDGAAHEFVRVDNEVRCLWPQERMVVVEWRPLERFPKLSEADARALLEHYAFSLGTMQRIAGQSCQLIRLTPKDHLRFGHQLCVTHPDGLVLSAQILNEQGQIIEQMAFAEIQVVETLDAAHLNPSWATDGWRVLRTEHEPIDVRGQGWVFAVPEGFKRVREVSRKIFVAGDVARWKQTMQSVYSDGLATLSVFIEPADLKLDDGDRAVPANAPVGARGATHAWSRRVGQAQVTVVGEVPAATVLQVGHSVQFEPAK